MKLFSARIRGIAVRVSALASLGIGACASENAQNGNPDPTNPTDPTTDPTTEDTLGGTGEPPDTEAPDTTPTDTTSGTAPTDPVAYTGTFPAGLSGYQEVTLTVGGVARKVGLYRPDSAPAHPALIVAFHGTGSNPNDFLDEAGLRGFADQTGVVIAAPQALERNGGQGEAGDPDHFAGSEASYGTSWNLTSGDPDANNDLVLVRATIQAARNAWGVDSDHVYALGHSNGAFFSYLAGVALSDRLAGFAENAGGAVRCANKGPDGSQFTGSATTCAALATQSGYPTCQGDLKPVALSGGRVPWGFLAHHRDDDIVSVAWTCTLADALGARAQVYIKAPDDNSHGHSVVDGFADRAWAFLSQHSRTD